MPAPIAWHPLRALNAINVQTLGADLLTVHVQLDLGQAGQSRAGASTGAPSPLPARIGPPARAA